MEAIPDESEKYNYKLSDEEFLAIFKENNCLCSQTARAITLKFGIKYTRQAVFDRAKKFEKEIARFSEEVLDLADEAIFESVKQNKDMKLKFRAALFIRNKFGSQSGQNSINK